MFNADLYCMHFFCLRYCSFGSENVAHEFQNLLCEKCTTLNCILMSLLICLCMKNTDKLLIYTILCTTCDFRGHNHTHPQFSLLETELLIPPYRFAPQKMILLTMLLSLTVTLGNSESPL